MKELDREIFFALFAGTEPGSLLFVMVALTIIGRGYALWILALLSLVPARLSQLGGRTWISPRMQRIAREMLLTLIGIAIVVFVTKLVVQRPRPYVELGLLPAGGRVPTDFSFPSGHAAGAFGFAAFLVARLALRTPLAFALFGLAAAIGVSRIYLGVHFPSDVGVGALLGASVAWLSGRKLRRREHAQLAKRGVAGADSAA